MFGFFRSGLAALAVFAIAGIIGALAFFSVSQSAQKRVQRKALPEKFAKPDAVTAKIRDPQMELIRVPAGDANTLEKIKKVGVVAEDYGSFVIATAPKGTFGSLRRTEARLLDTSVNLPGASFDPVQKYGGGKPASKEFAKPTRTGYYIVQFGTTATDEMLQSVRDTGAEIIQYIPNRAFIVFGREDTMNTLSTHSRIRWIGQYLPEYKVGEVLKEQLKGKRSKDVASGKIAPIEKTGKDTAIFDIAVFGNANLEFTADHVAAIYGGKNINKIELPRNFFNILRVELPINNVQYLSQIPEVFSIQAWSKPQKEDEVAAQIVAGNYAGNVVAPPGYNPLTQFGVDGTGVTVSVVDDGVGIPGDGGFYITSGNTVNGPLRGATTGAEGHGHLNATIIAGTTPFSVLDPNGYNYALGIAPGANIINIPFLRAGYTGTEIATTNDTVVTAGPNGVTGYISNNSWGNGTNGNAYDAYAAEFDGYVRDGSASGSIDPLVMVFSAGNSGTSGLTRPKVAKNVISVAATENVRPTLNSAGGTTGAADNLEQLPDFSSRGPAADGRVKPDIAAPGDAVTGGRSGTDVLFGNIGTYHRTSSGTSHAAPQVAGAAALFTEFWKNGHAGMNPSPAMVKAALINGAVEVTGTGATAPRPNGSEGWGRINLSNVLNTGESMSYFDQDAPLTNVGQTAFYSGTVTDSGRPVRVSLVWTDPPGAADPALVNDLDLRVTFNGSTYKGNVFSGGSSTVGGVEDVVNNVENVFLPAGQSGPIYVTVTASALNGDGIFVNGDPTDQHFALVAYNGSISPDSSAFLQPGSANITSGNSVAEPSECNLLYIPITNSGGTTATNVSAVLSTTTPGVTVQGANRSYPNIAPGATAQNVTPFALSTDNSVACFTNIDLTLTVTMTGGASPAVSNFSVPVGQPGGTNYVFSQSTGATISAGGTLVAGTNADDALVNFAAPFAFSVYGTNVASGSNIRIATNGFIRIETAGSASSANTNGPLPSTGSGSFPASLPVIMPYWDDLDMSNPLSGGGVYSEVTGSVGTRTLKLEWRARHFVGGQGAGSPNTNFAVYFHEGSNSFEFVYAQTGASPYASGASATVGVQSATTGTTFTQFSSNTASLSSGLKLSAAIPQAICTAGTGPCVASAAGVEVTGRVVSSTGRGIRGALVSITDANGAARSTLTNTFGYFRFTDVRAGENYVLSVAARRYTFPTSFVQVNDAISDILIVSGQ